MTEEELVKLKLEWFIKLQDQGWGTRVPIDGDKSTVHKLMGSAAEFEHRRWTFTELMEHVDQLIFWAQQMPRAPQEKPDADDAGRDC